MLLANLDNCSMCILVVRLQALELVKESFGSLDARNSILSALDGTQDKVCA